MIAHLWAKNPGRVDSFRWFYRPVGICYDMIKVNVLLIKDCSKTTSWCIYTQYKRPAVICIGYDWGIWTAFVWLFWMMYLWLLPSQKALTFDFLVELPTCRSLSCLTFLLNPFTNRRKCPEKPNRNLTPLTLLSTGKSWSTIISSQAV